ncbi:hypothetical protein BDR22DRAFT_894293 [Usnea florida]
MAPTKDVLLSSPDPLGMSNGSIPSHPPTKEGHSLSITPRKALTEASGNTQVQEFYINTPPHPRRNASPIKSPGQTTQSTSPWRIRLTVQAEQVDEMQKSKHVSGKRLTEQTTTITVPLKGGDDTPPVLQKKGRGRPRKSLDSPVKRAGTPKPKGGGRRKTMCESPKRREIDAHGQVATPPKKPRGRPRKSIEPKGEGPSLVLSQSNDPDVWLGSSLVGGEEMTEMKPKAARTRSRARRQEITPMKISAGSDIESQSSSVATTGEIPKELAWTLGNGPVESDLMDQRLPQSYEATTPQTNQGLDSGVPHGQPSLGNQSENNPRSVLHQNTCSTSPLGDDPQNQDEPDPTFQPQEYDSILESEGFSMVSVSSLPSVGDNAISPPQQYGSLPEHTPIIASSPFVPPAPETTKIRSSPRHLEIPSDGTPKLAKVLRAGVALQGALNTKDRSQELGSPFQESQRPSPFLTEETSGSQREFPHRPPRERSPEVQSDDPFRGFGAGTRRELKAGLRLGEELAKRQRQTSQISDVGSREVDDTFQQTRDTTYPQLPVSDTKDGYGFKPSGSESQVRYPLLSNTQLLSPESSLLDEEEDRMSWKADTPIKQEGPTPVSAPILVSDETIGPNDSTVDYTMMARQEEWQREREAVSKQIEMANKSRVIVIESDDEDNEDPADNAADSDIWQAEAHSVNQSRDTTPGASDILPPAELLKPRRSKIPSPWRRNSQVIYSDEVEPAESDLFWQPDQSQARASKRRHAAKCQSEDQSDTSAVSVLDTSMENTRKAEAQIQLEASKALPVEDSLSSGEEDRITATSVDHPRDHGFIQDADQTINPSVAATPSENPTVLELQPSPKLATTEKVATTEDAIEVVEKIATPKVMEGTSTEPDKISNDGKAAIDPRLLRKKIRPSNASRQGLGPIQSLQATQSSTSWLSRLTTPIWSVFAPAAPLPPAATREDILCSSPYEPLCQLTPWEECHFRALGPLYYSSLLYGAHLFPFNPRSPSARFCGAYVTTKLGWSRKVTPEDCGITDAFMVLLDERGFALGEPGARWIDESIVLGMCVKLWMGMIKRGEIEADRSKGERTGLRDQGDRKWTKDDIDWASNESAYFERKRREFDGLPSWKNKT